MEDKLSWGTQGRHKTWKQTQEGRMENCQRARGKKQTLINKGSEQMTNTKTVGKDKDRRWKVTTGEKKFCMPKCSWSFTALQHSPKQLRQMRTCLTICNKFFRP